MRSVFWTVFLVVVLQGMAPTSTAVASPTTDTASAADTLPASESTTTRLEGNKTQPTLRADLERKRVRTQSEVLSKNFSNPKPVQIYWFFGGR